MKIGELLDIEQFKSFRRSDLQILDNYLEEDIVIAYYKSNMGCVIITKTKRTYVAFYFLEDDISGFYYNNSQRISITQALNLMKKDIIVLDEEELNIAKRKEMLKKL